MFADRGTRRRVLSDRAFTPSLCMALDFEKDRGRHPGIEKRKTFCFVFARSCLATWNFIADLGHGISWEIAPRVESVREMGYPLRGRRKLHYSWSGAPHVNLSHQANKEYSAARWGFGGKSTSNFSKEKDNGMHTLGN